MALSKEEDLMINANLYEALMSQTDDKVIELCKRIPKGPLHTLTIHEDTVLHMATYHKKTDLVLKLLDMVSECDTHKLTWQNNGGNTILHETGTNNKTVKVAVELLRRAPMLLNMTNKEGETALFYAARHGKTRPFRFLHDEVRRAIQGPDLATFLRRDDQFTILHIAVLSRNYMIALEIAENYRELIGEKDADGMTALQHLSTTKPEFHPKNFFKRMIFKVIDTDIEYEGYLMFRYLKKLRKQKHACEWAMKIAQLLIKEDNSWEKTESWTDMRGSKFHEYGKSTSTVKQEKKISIAHEVDYHKPDTPLLLATKHDSTEIVKEILKVYPQAVEHVDKDGRTILHLAILHRRHKIIDVVEDMNYPLERLRGRLDKNFNTLLHMVGQRVDELAEDVKHPAQQLKDDQRLYKRVEKLCTTLDAMTRNSDLKTAYEVFSETNDQLRSEAKEWMCENAKNCSLVAVLIATVAFTSVYTVPGGPDETGHPVLKKKPMFLLFTLADSISLSTALTSVILFLNIVTSQFRYKDFASSLFEKQFTALVLLIISVAMMMVAFAATLVLTISSKAKWTDVTLYGVSFFPVFVFVYEYMQQYIEVVKDFKRVLKPMMEKVVEIHHEIWNYKPHSLHPLIDSMDLTTRSPV
ncbi:ankyrin repeat-containing protein At5g02620 [Lactuca sativa]|uniref:ankyrin repeat-containing protein At5g02620 n=1 Tax=Lactuca sativa TaxID=4236 RepID=UPI000CD8F82B|nr:ankyrin repeat-containing protein At5g02620 [Lactuca sativa]